MMMAVTELLVLVTLSHLLAFAQAFCWKPNINPFMGTNHLKIDDNIFGGSSWVQKVPLIRSELTCQRCGSAGTTSSQRALLAKRFFFLSKVSFYRHHHLSHCDRENFAPGRLSDQVSSPRCTLQLQTLRPHTQGLLLLMAHCLRGKNAISDGCSTVVIKMNGIGLDGLLLVR